MQEIPLEWLGRNLGVLEHMQGISAQIPNSITFFQMYQVERPSQLRIEERWRKIILQNHWQYRLVQEQPEIMCI